MVISRRQLGWVIGCFAGGLISPPAHGDIPRVTKIRKRAQPRVEHKFLDKGLHYPAHRLYLRAFKHEGELEMWAADGPGEAMTLVETYPICAASGELGPKRRQGDEQVPEGLYQIHRFNGWSGYHMSLRVNYPNASDRARGLRWKLGGAIMVHGDCVTIGCIPIQNAPIEEVFLATLDASRAGKQRVPIHIFPRRMDARGMAYLEQYAAQDKRREDLEVLWKELEPFYIYFETHHQVPDAIIDTKTGVYTLVDSPDS